MLRSYRIVARNPAYLAYLGITSASYAGLFAWISGSAFVLQDLYGLARRSISALPSRSVRSVT